ncbi:MAG: ComEC/Rec2 family competence protein, partial [Candidatus Binatia bacterium]
MDTVASEPRRTERAGISPAVLLVLPTLSLLLGQALAAIGAIPSSLTFLSCVTVLFVALYLWRKGMRQWTLAVVLSAAAFSLGYSMHYRTLHPRFTPGHLRLIAEGRESLYIEGLLYREPERLPDRSRWYVKAERIWRPNGAQETDGNILVTVRSERAEWHYGDRVRVWLRVRPPRDPGNPGGFNYEAYLARRQIYLTGFLESDTGVELLRREGNRLWSGIEHLRREIGRFFARHLPHEQAVLMKALVVGDMGGISQEMRESFAAAGVAHVLSISGLHVGMLGLVAFFLVRFLGSFSATLLLRWNLLKAAALSSFLAVLFYTALAGAMVPTVRSAIMIGVYQLAILFDREEEIFGSLALAALLIGLIWPGVILDISFQLSFLAVLFIIWGLRSLREWWPVRKREELP